MSGGSQHNPNGRQAQIGAAWSPLQLQVASLLARAPQAHMPSERGVTWHTPTPPPHLYHVPAPSPPDPLQALQLQAMKGASVFRHMLEPTARHSVTPPDLFRHTPTPPDKHLVRHTPSPGDVKSAPVIPPVELFPHLGSNRDKVGRGEELVSLARGVDLSTGGRGAPPPAHTPPAPAPAPALSVRDAPTINSLIARAQPRPGAPRVDALLSRLAPPGPPSPRSVIVPLPLSHPLPLPLPLPLPHPAPHRSEPHEMDHDHSSNEDSADSCGAPPGSKRKRKPSRTVRAPPSLENGHGPPQPAPPPAPPNGPLPPHPPPHESPTFTQEDPPSPLPHKSHARRKSSNSETIDDIAAMIKNPDFPTSAIPAEVPEVSEVDGPVTIDKLKSVLTNSMEGPNTIEESERKKSPGKSGKESEPAESAVEAAAAPKRRVATTSTSESTNVPVESPSEAKPAEPSEEPSSEARTAEPNPGPNPGPDTGPSPGPSPGPSVPTAEPNAANFVEVENQLEKMFAGLEEEPKERNGKQKSNRGRKRRKSAPSKSEAKAGRSEGRATAGEERRKGGRGRGKGRGKERECDEGSNASSGRSRGPYIQIRGPRDSPLSVCVVNAVGGEDEDAPPRRREFRNGHRIRGLHQSTLGLRYDATTADATWLCAFCQRGPHANQLGDLFGPYTIDTDCDEYRSLDEATRRQFSDALEVWTHESCLVWAGRALASGRGLWGLGGAVWGARGARCRCGKGGAQLACRARGCPARAHYPCAVSANWTLNEEEFRALCPAHSNV